MQNTNRWPTVWLLVVPVVILVALAALCWGPVAVGHPQAQTTPTPTCPPPPALCTPARQYGYQPFPAAIQTPFVQAARNTLGSTGPTYSSISRGVPTQYPSGTGVTNLDISSAEPLPSTILRAIGWDEGGEKWRQFNVSYGLSGCTYMGETGSCDYGLMQINQGSMGTMDKVRIAGEVPYNIGAGANVLISKWNWVVPWISPRNHTLADNWYYAVAAYGPDGWDWPKNPNNPRYDPQREPFHDPTLNWSAWPYQELIWGFMSHPGIYNEQPLWPAVRVPWVPRGIWGDSEEDWAPTQWTSRPTFYALPDARFNYSGWDSYLVMQNALPHPHYYHLAADVGLYNQDGSFRKWILPSGMPFHIPAWGVTSLPVGVAFEPWQSFSGPSLACASQDVGIMVQNASADQIYAYAGVALPGSVPDVGYSLAGPTAYLPRLCNGHEDWSTSFIVQNVGTQDTTVNITYYNASTGQAQVCASLPLAPDAARIIDQNWGLRQMNWPLGSGIIASNNDQPLVVTVKAQHNSGTTTAYNALTQGASRVHAPLLMADYTGWYASPPLPTPTPVGSYRVYLPLVMKSNPWYTDLVVQNVGAAATHVTVHYYPAPGAAAKSAETHWNVGPGQSTTFRTTGGPWIGAAEATSSNGVSLVNDGFSGSIVITSNPNPVAVVTNMLEGATRMMTYNGLPR